MKHRETQCYNQFHLTANQKLETPITNIRPAQQEPSYGNNQQTASEWRSPPPVVRGATGPCKNSPSTLILTPAVIHS